MIPIPPDPTLVFVASDWDDSAHAAIVSGLRDAGFSVFDYRRGIVAPPGWSPVYSNPVATRQMYRRAIIAAHVVVLIVPGGVDTAWAVGYAQGVGTPLVTWASSDHPSPVWSGHAVSADRLDDLAHCILRTRRETPARNWPSGMESATVAPAGPMS